MRFALINHIHYLKENAQHLFNERAANRKKEKLKSEQLGE